MKKILVATDFSGNSKAGIRFAIQLASQAPFELVFFNVNEVSSINAWTDLNYSDFKSAENAQLKEKLRKFVAGVYRTARKQGGKLECVIDNSADTDSAMIAYAQKINADFICIGTRGGGTVRKLLGSNASKLITTSPIPLFVVPQTYHSKWLDSILYASDMENIAPELKVVSQFSLPLAADIKVFHYDYFLEDNGVMGKLDAAAAAHRSPSVSFHFRKLVPEYPLLSLLERDIRLSKPSLVVMFTKQDRSWFERLFLSSKTAELGFGTKIPLLVFRK
ncbi:universal stress protein [Flavobacterium sp.]|uniref:universal stress protein n=1 Tax=Flavobacterium sp. TaxID=239 RepID=UPI0026087D84|nr:universal stress protein [Flavobacterium sp.]